MAYSKERLEKQAVDAITEHKLYFMNEVHVYLPCSRATFYNLELEKMDSIKDALENNKLITKTELRKKWYDSDNATLQVVLMKLISNNDERKMMSQSYTDITSDEKPINISVVEFVGTDDQDDKDES